MRETRAESWLHLQELLFTEGWNESSGGFARTSSTAARAGPRTS